jgi:hypothetical protein
MDLSRSTYGEIIEMIRRETRYLRHYWGEVLSTTDQLNRGRVLVSIPALGWNSADTGPWCMPRDKYSMIVPNVGDFVEVYFLEGDRDKPVYLGIVSEITGGTPANYTTPKERILYQDKDTEDYLLYNSATGELSFIVGGFKIWQYLNGIITWFEGSEPFVLGTQLNNYLSNLVTEFATHIHIGVTTGGGSSGVPATGLTAPSGLLSSKIKGI